MNNEHLFLFIIPIGWIAIATLISLLSGWRELAKYYSFAGQAVDKKRYFQSATFRGGANYGGCLIIGASLEGLYLSTFFIFRPGHSPLFIPWRDIKIERKSYFGFSVLELKFTQVPSVIIKISQSLEGFLQSAAGRPLPITETTELSKATLAKNRYRWLHLIGFLCAMAAANYNFFFDSHTPRTVKQNYENGKLRFEGKVVRGQYDGLLKWYREDGSLFKDGEYSKGIENGEFKAYYPSGKLQYAGQMINGRWEGLATWYAENGTLLRKAIYRNNRRMSYSVSPEYIHYPEKNVALYLLKSLSGQEIVVKIDYKEFSRKIEDVTFYSPQASADGQYDFELISNEKRKVKISLSYQNSFIIHTRIDTDFRPSLEDINKPTTMTVLSEKEEGLLFTFTWTADGNIKNVNVKPVGINA